MVKDFIAKYIYIYTHIWFKASIKIIVVLSMFLIYIKIGEYLNEFVLYMA